MHRTLVEAQSELVSLSERDGTLVYVSPAYAAHFGQTPDALLGVNILDHVDEADRTTVHRRIEEVFAGRQPDASENRMQSADGERRWVSWKNSLVVDSSGRTLLLSVGRDVTERRAVEVELQASQSLLARTGRLAGVGGWELELTSQRLHWSEQTRRLFEVGDDFVPTLEAGLLFFAAEARPAIVAAMEAAQTHGTPWDMELPLVTATGRRLWTRSLGEVEREDGVVVRLLGSIVDITEPRLLAERLAQSERFVRQVTDNLPIAIAYTDRDLRYLFVNLEHCRRSGKSREETLGRTYEEVNGRSFDAPTRRRLELALAGQPQRFEFELAWGGSARLVEFQFVPDIDTDGSVRGLYSAAFDITERSAIERELRDLTAIIETSPDFVVQTDRHGAVSYMNPAARRFTGLGPADPTTDRHASDFNPPDSDESYRREIAMTVKAVGVWSGEARVRGAGGIEVPVSHLVIGHRGVDRRVERYSAVMRDISRAVEARRDLQAQTSALRAVMEAIPAIVAVVGPDGRVRLVNSAYERWTGIDRVQAVGGTLAAAIGPEDDAGAVPWIRRALAGETGSFERAVESAAGLRHLAGSYSPMYTDDGVVDGFIAVAEDVSEHKREEVRLLQLARRDPLTGLFNRAGFEAEAERLIRDGQGDRLALLCIDLDHFKAVNDSHGHPVGDALLRAFAQRMVRLVRTGDTVARLGGDEFAILLSGPGFEAGCRVVADKVVAAAGERFNVGGLRLRVGASVGIALRADTVGGWTGLVARADAMLYGRRRRAEDGG